MCMFPEHVHTADCLIETVYLCGLEEHVHIDECFDENWALICPIEEHLHNEDCLSAPVYYCGWEEHIHTDACFNTDGYLVCEMQEHLHGAECRQPVYYCGLEEHIHMEGCFDAEGVLICAIPEHLHSEDCTMQAMTLMLADSGLAEGIYGDYTYQINHQKDAFSKDPAFVDFCQDRPLGVAGNFHVVAFGTANLEVHTNGGILARKAIVKTNFGTNKLKNELSYIQEYEVVNGISASALNGHYLVVGSNNTVTLVGNNDYLAVNGTKIDKPDHIIQDADTESAPFIDIDRVEREVAGISARLESYGASAEGTVEADISERNKRKLTLKNPNAAGYFNTTADVINTMGVDSDTLRVYGFEYGCIGSLIVNVDCSGYTGTIIKMPNVEMFIGEDKQNTTEVTNFSNGKILWNFINADGIKIEVGNAFSSILAMGADVIAAGSVNGTVVCENFVNKTESHRTDFTGTFIPSTGSQSGPFIVLEKTDVDDSSLLLPGATFELYDTSMNLIKSGTTNDNGVILFDGLEYDVIYVLKETVVPDGYKLDADPFYFMIPTPSDEQPKGDQEEIYKEFIKDIGWVHYVTQGGSVNITNERMPELVIQKQWKTLDENAVIPESIEVRLMRRVENRDDIKPELIGTITLQASENWKYTISSSELERTVEIDGVTCNYLYYVEEPKVPKGFSVQYSNNDGINHGVITLVNSENLISVSVKKEWEVEDGTELPDSINVTLYCKAASGRTGKPVSETVTLYKAEGYAYTWYNMPIFNVNGKPNIYYVVEEAVDGFGVIRFDEKTFAEANKAENGLHLNLTITNGVKTNEAPLVVQKVDQFGKPVAGAEFAFYPANSESQALEGRVINDGTAIAYDNIPDGTYQLKETKAPDGFNLLDGVIELKFADGKISKTNGWNGINSQSELIFDEENRRVTIQVTNIHSIDFAVAKVDENGAPLRGAQLSLVTGNAEVSPEVSEDGSVFYYKLIPYGYYVLTEVTAPDGYKRATGQLIFQIDDVGNLKTIDRQGDFKLLLSDGVVDEDIYYRVFTLKNERDETPDLTYELPETGGHGRSTYTLGGALLLMLATLLLYRSRMGRREGKENRA